MKKKVSLNINSQAEDIKCRQDLTIARNKLMDTHNFRNYAKLSENNFKRSGRFGVKFITDNEELQSGSNCNLTNQSDSSCKLVDEHESGSSCKLVDISKMIQNRKKSNIQNELNEKNLIDFYNRAEKNHYLHNHKMDGFSYEYLNSNMETIPTLDINKTKKRQRVATGKKLETLLDDSDPELDQDNKEILSSRDEYNIKLFNREIIERTINTNEVNKDDKLDENLDTLKKLNITTYPKECYSYDLQAASLNCTN